MTAAGHRVESAADPLTQQLCEVLFKLGFDFWGVEGRGVITNRMMFSPNSAT